MIEPRMIDLTRDRTLLAGLYAPKTGVFSVVDVPLLPFAVLHGEGPPEAGSVEKAVKNLYTAIYPIRREARVRMGKTFVEAPVEILYWADDPNDFASGNRANWRWRVQITLPVWADALSLDESTLEMRDQLGNDVSVHWIAEAEGRCVQILHVGKTDDVPGLLENLYSQYLPQHGLLPSGPYHEIYLDDWNRIELGMRKVILRQPVQQGTH